MQGNAPMHPGQGPGLSLHDLGETGGSDTVTLLESEIPAHSHAVSASAGEGKTGQPGGQKGAQGVGVNAYAFPASAPLTPLNPQTIAPAGGDQPHNNMQPYLTFFFN